MNAAPETVPEGWEGILSPGERILWQGRPEGRFTLRGHSFILIGVGAIFSAVALLFISVGLSLGDLVFTLFPMVHLTVGLGLMVGPPFWRTYVWRNTWYTLTDRRAIIATDIWPKGRDLSLYDVGPDSPLLLVERPWPGVHFAMRHSRGKHGVRVVPFGFERLADAKAVFDMMTTIKQGKA
jgi:hypothetical protein